MYNIDSVCSVGGNRDRGEIFIGDAESATDTSLLRDLKITHVLNAAEGEVQTGSGYYNGLFYLGLTLTDLPNENIFQYFDTVTDFIHHCLSRQGKILVHCAMGISRSSTCVISYLIKYCNMDVDQALKFLRRKRAIINPNIGFIKQLRRYKNNF